LAENVIPSFGELSQLPILIPQKAADVRSVRTWKCRLVFVVLRMQNKVLQGSKTMLSIYIFNNFKKGLKQT
jgi:hypothetical protein